MHKSLAHFLPRGLAGAVLACLVLSMMFLLVGCGGHHQTQAVATPTPTPAVPTSTAQIRIGDAPVDQLIGFEMTIANPIVATLNTGKTINATIANNRLELSRTASKMEPILIQDLPQGTYTSIEMTILDPAVTYVYQHGWVVESFGDGRGSIVARDFPGQQTVKVDFNPPVALGSAATVVTIDVNLAKAIVVDGPEITNVQFTPEVFTFTGQEIPAAAAQHHHNGELECMIGQITAVNGSKLTVSAGQSGGLLDVQTDSTTLFHESITDAASTLGRVVELDGYSDANGKLVATEVEGLATQNGAAVQGVIIDAGNDFGTRNNFGYKADSFQIIAQDATGVNAKADNVGATYTVHIDYLTDNAFTLDPGKTDTSMPLPPFDSRHLFPGQRVAVATGSALPDGDFTHFTATKVMLEQQAVTGTIEHYRANQDGSADFLLDLPFDSYVHRLSGYGHIWVHQSANTDLELLSTNTDQVIGNGSTVRVRGLIFLSTGFFNTLSAPSTTPFFDSLTMTSRRITEMAPEAVPVNGTN